MASELERQAALRLLFDFFVAEEFYNEQWSTAADMSEDLWNYATGGLPYVLARVEGWLDYELTFNRLPPRLADDVARRMRVVANGNPNAEELATAATLIWTEKEKR